MENTHLTIDDIASEELQTLYDLISGDFCECNHLIENEHYKGDQSGVDKCFALFFNGTVWESCRCSKIRIKEFCISVKVPDHAEDSQN